MRLKDKSNTYNYVLIDASDIIRRSASKASDDREIAQLILHVYARKVQRFAQSGVNLALFDGPDMDAEHSALYPKHRAKTGNGPDAMADVSEYGDANNIIQAVKEGKLTGHIGKALSNLESSRRFDLSREFLRLRLDAGWRPL